MRRQTDKNLCTRSKNRIFHQKPVESDRLRRTHLFKTLIFRAFFRNSAHESVDKMKKTDKINACPQKGMCISKLEVCMKKVVCLLLALVMLLGLVACASNTAPATEKTETTTTE